MNMMVNFSMLHFSNLSYLNKSYICLILFSRKTMDAWHVISWLSILLGFTQATNSEWLGLYFFWTEYHKWESSHITSLGWTWLLCSSMNRPVKGDTINHDLLIAKLRAYDLRGNSLKLIMNYLRYRYQRTEFMVSSSQASHKILC